MTKPSTLSIMIHSGTHAHGKTNAAKAMIEALRGKRDILTLEHRAATIIPPVEGYRVFEQDLQAAQYGSHQPVVLERSVSAPVLFAPADHHDVITRAILTNTP